MERELTKEEKEELDNYIPPDDYYEVDLNGEFIDDVYDED